MNLQNDDNVFEEHIREFMFMIIIENFLNSISHKGGGKFPGVNCYTGCFNSICPPKNAYYAIKNALLSHKDGICTFMRCGILT